MTSRTGMTIALVAVLAAGGCEDSSDDVIPPARSDASADDADATPGADAAAVDAETPPSCAGDVVDGEACDTVGETCATADGCCVCGGLDPSCSSVWVCVTPGDNHPSCADDPPTDLTECTIRNDLTCTYCLDATPFEAVCTPADTDTDCEATDFDDCWRITPSCG